MAEDEQVRQNRLALLFIIAADLKQFADFSKLIG
jgi:glycyl-tRNA synthetase beta chain